MPRLAIKATVAAKEKKPHEMSDEELTKLMQGLQKFEVYVGGSIELPAMAHKILDKCKNIGQLGED